MGWQFEGVASSTRVDRQGEMLTAEALAEAEVAGVALVATHQRRTEVLGLVEECAVDGAVLRVRGQLLADAPGARELRERLATEGRLGLSLGGKVARAHMGWSAEREGPVRHLDEVRVEHVAVCGPGEAVNPDAWIALKAPSPRPAGAGQGSGD